MQKRILFFLPLLALCSEAWSSPITPDEALARLEEPNPETATHKAAPRKARKGARLVHTAVTHDGDPAIYIFNQPDQAGYLMLSADDRSYPLLGYADSGSFSESEMSPQMQWWLSEYSSQIEYMRSLPIQFRAPSVRAVEGREAIAPMITTHWDQAEPYWNMTPVVSGVHTYTGCVATALAQVMNYWEYPAIGKGTLSYTCENIGKRLMLNLETTPFDWNNMPDTYVEGQYTPEQADAVAYLMKACGYSVKMEYSTTASSALALQLAGALTKNFDYDPNVLYALRNTHSATEWDNMVYDNLKNVGPVLYCGSSRIGGGHAFVCDGYDGNGYYHFNWGWSGVSDGYFLLDALSPDVLGIGGGGGGGYSFNQDAVFGIQPPTGRPAETRPLELVQMGSLHGEAEGSIIKFSLDGQTDGSVINYNATSMKVLFGAIFEPADGSQSFSLPAADRTVTLKPGYGTAPTAIDSKIDLSAASLADGTYKVTYAFRLDGESDYRPTLAAYGYDNCITIHKKGDNYTIDNRPVQNLRIVDASLQPYLIFGGLGAVTIKIENPTDIELTRGFAPALFYKDPDTETVEMFFLGESKLITVAPHSTIEDEWVSNLYVVKNNLIGLNNDAEFLLTFFDESSYTFFISDIFKPTVMHPNNEAPSFKQTSVPQIVGAKTVLTTINGQPARVYQAPDKDKIEVTAHMELASGHYAYMMNACITSFNPNSQEGSEVIAYSGKPYFLDNPGDSFDFASTLSLPQAKSSDLYGLTMAYIYGSGLVPAGNSIIFTVANGVDGIDNVIVDSDSAADAPIFNLQGIDMGTDLEALPAGIYIRNGKKIIKN